MSLCCQNWCSHLKSLKVQDICSYGKNLPVTVGNIPLAKLLITSGFLLGCRVIFKNNKLVVFFPSLMYDALQYMFVPLNYFLGSVTYLLPTGSSRWSEPGFDSAPMDVPAEEVAAVKADIIADRDVAHREQVYVALYDTLPAVTAEADLINRTWNGRILRTNCSLLDLADWLLVRPLGLLGFKWGKRYRSQHVGDPLLVRWLNTLYFPLPVWGNVGMVDIRWRGVCTATMNYDYQPWKDYFRLLSSDNGKVVLLGVWTHKEVAGGWFTLTLDNEVPTN